MRWSDLRKDINPFGNGSQTWKVFYFFKRTGKGRKNGVRLYSSYGRTSEEALKGLVVAILDEGKFHTGTIRQAQEPDDLIKLFREVSAEEFLEEARRKEKNTSVEKNKRKYRSLARVTVREMG